MCFGVFIWCSHRPLNLSVRNRCSQATATSSIRTSTVGSGDDGPCFLQAGFSELSTLRRPVTAANMRLSAVAVQRVERFRIECRAVVYRKPDLAIARAFLGSAALETLALTSAWSYDAASLKSTDMSALHEVRMRCPSLFAIVLGSVVDPALGKADAREAGQRQRQRLPARPGVVDCLHGTGRHQALREHEGWTQGHRRRVNCVVASAPVNTTCRSSRMQNASPLTRLPRRSSTTMSSTASAAGAWSSDGSTSTCGPSSGGKRMASITTDMVKAYVVARWEQGIRNQKGERRADVSNAEINRERRS